MWRTIIWGVVVIRGMVAQWLVRSGASIPPEAMMHFPPLFQIFPLFPKNFLTPCKISQILPFPGNFFGFHLPKFLMTLLFWSSATNFEFPPYFRYVNTFPPIFRQNYSFHSTFINFPPVFSKFTCFLHTLCVFRFPPTFTMMHLCITQCTYWMPLCSVPCIRKIAGLNPTLAAMLIPTQYQCCSRERLVVVDLKRCYKNIQNE